MKKAILLLAILVVIICTIVVRKQSTETQLAYKTKYPSSSLFKINPMVIVKKVRY